jgi:hypothetical protein
MASKIDDAKERLTHLRAIWTKVIADIEASGPVVKTERSTKLHPGIHALPRLRKAIAEQEQYIAELEAAEAPRALAINPNLVASRQRTLSEKRSLAARKKRTK